LYDAAWNNVRAKGKHNDLLWHKVYDEYINSLPLAKLGARDELIEKHLRIVGPIAGQIAWRRAPHSFGIWSKEYSPNLSHVGLVHELTAMGNLGLFIAADRYDPTKGAFSTYANPWIKKFIRLYLEELVSVGPRNDPNRRVMDIFDAAIEQRRLYRGKAAGGPAIFDGSITIPGRKPKDKEIETVGSDGPTINPGLDYLQRRVSFRLYPWTDLGAHFTPRFALPGHPGGRASALPPVDYGSKAALAVACDCATCRLLGPGEIRDFWQRHSGKRVPIEHMGPSTKVIVPRYRIYEGRLERRLQTHNSNGGKTWRKPTIRIHTYPKGMAFPMAAE
jgi:hypothetical protein